MKHNICYLGIGSNIEPRIQHIYRCLELLGQNSSIHILQKAFIYESDPVDCVSKDKFLNTVISIQTLLSPAELYQTIMVVEGQFYRNRKVFNGPRQMDIDILTYNDIVYQDSNLNIPHPRMHLRRFVLKPFRDIAPTWQHPILHKNVQLLLSELKDEFNVTIYQDFQAVS